MVEHATENRSVGGSTPPLGTIPLNARQLELYRHCRVAFFDRILWFRRSLLQCLDAFLFCSRSLIGNFKMLAIESAHSPIGLFGSVAVALVDFARRVALVRHDRLAGFTLQAKIVQFFA